MDLCSARWDDLQAEIESKKTRFVPSAQPPSAQPPAAARFAPLRGTQPQRCAALCCAALRAAPLGALYARPARCARRLFGNHERNANLLTGEGSAERIQTVSHTNTPTEGGGGGGGWVQGGWGGGRGRSCYSRTVHSASGCWHSSKAPSTKEATWLGVVEPWCRTVVCRRALGCEWGGSREWRGVGERLFTPFQTTP